MALQNHGMEHNAGTASRALNDTIALEIQIEMLRRGWSQADLAERMGKTEMWVSRRIKVKGERQQMTVNELPLFAEALGVDMIDLMGQARRGSMSTKTSLTRKIRNGAVRTIIPAAAAPLTGRVPAPKPRVPSTVTKHDHPVDAKRRLARLPHSHA